MTPKPPLHIHLLYNPQSERAGKIAESLVPRWMSAPGTQGQRVPVFLTPDDGSGLPPISLGLEAAEHNLIVVLVDGCMVQRIKGHGAEWAAFVRELVDAHPPGAANHAMLVALDRHAWGLDREIANRHFLPLDHETDVDVQRRRVDFTMCVRALHLLRQGVPEEPDGANTAPITLFVSHAKGDLHTKRQDPVGLTQQALMRLPVKEWFDAREIRESARFEDEIRAGIAKCDAVLIFLTDLWSSRPWCRIEALIAKELRKPTLVVDALDVGERRSFPYGGNARSLHWQARLRPPADPAEFGLWQSEALAQGERVITAGVHEALRCLHGKRRIEGVSTPNDIVLDAAPEAARLAWSPPDATFFYPDPPLGREELALLQKVREHARFETPMTRFAKMRVDKLPKRFVVSISESSDLAQHGLTSYHERLLSDEVHLYLLLAGLIIVYGGKLDPDKLDDPDNFTLRLFSIVRSYSALADAVGTTGFRPVINAAPWPLHKLYNNDVYLQFGDYAKLEPYDLPDIGKSDAELGALENGFVRPDNPLQLYAWARALTHMREQVTDSAAARLCIGGKIEGYKGRIAGLIEEPLLSLRSKKPLFLVGALGGCTALVIDLLEQRERPEMTTAVAEANVENYQQIAALYKGQNAEWLTREMVSEEIRKAGEEGPAKALRNGLTDEENRLLFSSTDPIFIAQFVLNGLERLGI